MYEYNSFLITYFNLNLLFQESLGDVVFAQLPDTGTKIEKNGKYHTGRYIHYFRRHK